jgi:hypothetical protein
MNINNCKLCTTLLCATILTLLSSHANAINNGDFQTANFSGWSQDVDGLGALVASLNDFSIATSSSGNFAAHIEADYWSTSGDIYSTPQNEAFFANTLYQGLYLTASAGQDLILSFD